MNYPDNMNWNAYDRTIGSTGGGEPESILTEFEPIVLSECDECRARLMLNDIGLCRQCNQQAEDYGRALRSIYEKNGGILTEEAIQQLNQLTAEQLKGAL